MDGDLTPAEPSEPITLSQRFEEQFPIYLAMGMSADEYWNGDSTLVKAYRKANELRIKKENHAAWLQGMYIYNALCCVAPILNAFAKNGTKPHPYPEQPYELVQRKQPEKKDPPGMAYMDAFMTQFNKRFEEKERKELARDGDGRNAGTENC